MGFRSGNSDKMRMLANGNFGINTTSPTQKLHANGRIRAQTMELDSYIYHIGDTNSYFGFDNAYHFNVSVAGGMAISDDSNKCVGIGRNPTKKRPDVAGTLRCDERFYGDYYDYYEASSLTCTKTRRSSGHPSITFTIKAVNQVGWIRFTYSVRASGVYSNGSGHFERETFGHGRYYNGSHYINETSGVSFSSSQSGNRANLTRTMDEYARNNCISTVSIRLYEGIID
jgi:hypothetical protein